jgi:hypothetical protein
MRLLLICALTLAGALLPLQAGESSSQGDAAKSGNTASAYLGFDRNDYPGDTSLASLKQTFSFAGYWLNDPPGARSNTWTGKRSILRQRGFGFLVLFNGRTFSQLKPPNQPAALGANDASAAVEAALHEGFSRGTVIFLDQEEGGRLLMEQRVYLFAWIDGVIAAGFRPGVYCSGMPASEGNGSSIITANDIRDHAEKREIAFFVYNDACVPSPGCTYGKNLPPSMSGVSFASVWQFAQSPRRAEFTARCSSTYSADENCYPKENIAGNSISLDLDSATSSDPSNGR